MNLNLRGRLGHEISPLLCLTHLCFKPPPPPPRSITLAGRLYRASGC